MKKDEKTKLSVSLTLKELVYSFCPFEQIVDIDAS